MSANVRFALLVCTLLAACRGGAPGAAPTGGTGGAGPTSGAAGAAGGGSGGDATLASCPSPQAAPVNARVLSPSQYDNTVSDLLQVTGDPAQGFTGEGFAQLDDAAVEQRANAAAAVAHAAASALGAWAPCAPPAMDAATCERQIIEVVGARAFRRRLTDDDRAQMMALFDAGIAEKDFATGVEWFLTGLLQAPDFLYLVARPAADETPGEVVPIEAHDFASRLAYFVWDSPPDDALMAAADAGQLNDATGVRAQLARLIADARFSRGLTSFYSRWLRLDAFGEVARDDPAFGPDVARSLSTSLLLHATQLYAVPAPRLGDLLSGETYPLDATLRAFYGRPGTGDGFAPVVMDGEHRHGLLTHPGLMAMMSRPDASNPIARGLFVLGTVLCQDVPAPPAGIAIPPLPPLAAGLSTRDRLSAHAQSASCQACHDVIDAPGFAFESFDEVGRFRATDGGKVVDTSGAQRAGVDVAGPFADGDALLAKLAASGDVRACFARQYLQHALSRSTIVADGCSLDQLGRSFAASGGDLKQLVAAVAASDAFRLRLAEGLAP
jgi:hypothetical protein